MIIAAITAYVVLMYCVGYGLIFVSGSFSIEKLLLWLLSPVIVIPWVLLRVLAG